MRAEISKLDGHYILCSYGRVGRQVAAEFARDGVPFVVIEQDPRVVEECREEGHLAFVGEASNDDVLEEVGISRAKGLVAAVDSDADNVFVTLSARKFNPGLHIVARTPPPTSPRPSWRSPAPTAPSRPTPSEAEGSPRSPPSRSS
jgi:voltage-gated potassium channel